MIGNRDININLFALPFIPQSFFKHLLCAGYNWGDTEMTDTQALLLGSLQATGREDIHMDYQYT